MSLKKITVFSLFCLLLLNFQCDEDDLSTKSCGLVVVSNNETYDNAESDHYDVLDVNLYGHCLVFNISSSGCDGSSWDLSLIDSENIAESMPPQRYLKLTLTNNEDCLTVLEKTEPFNLTQLQVDGSNEVLLNIEGLSEPILYVY